MAKLLKLRRGTTSQHSSFTGAEGECTVDTTKDTLVVHDNSTAGGRPLLREDLNNIGTGTVTHAMLAGDCIDGDNLADNACDSEHYTDGSIDHVHLSGDCIDGDNLSDNACNSEHYTDGSIDTVHIGDDQVTYAKIKNVTATDRVLGRDSSGAGVIEEISPSSLRTMLNVADGANAYTHPNHSGEVTSTADGATVIADNIVDEANLKVSNSPTNGYVLTAQSGNTGGMTWEATTAGATGGNSNANAVFWENEQTVTHDYTIQNNYNAGSFGPITINSGVTVTVGSGENWSIV